MLEPLRMIPGPWFLLIIAGLAGPGIYFHFYHPWLPRRKHPPESRRLSPYDVGYLARGPRGLIEAALVAADSENLIQVDEKEKRIRPVPGAATDDPVVAELLEGLGMELGQLGMLKMPRSIQSTRRTLMAEKLLDPSSRLQVALRGLAIFGPLETLALLKLDLGLSLGRPVGFLVVVSAALTGVLGMSLVTQGRRGFPTPAGRQCLARRRSTLEPLLLDPQAARVRPSTNPLMAAVFGFRELASWSWSTTLPLVVAVATDSPSWMDPEVQEHEQRMAALNSGTREEGWSGSRAGADYAGASFASSGSDSGCGGGVSIGSSGSDSGCGGGSIGSSDSGCGGGGGGDSGCGGGGGCGGCGGGGGD